ncbi:hypothetical protein ACHMW4_03965 [Mesorhizobium sp. UC22_110]|uniref:hypothetical protein n=1 Tax=unclassified Mesorhizobium TaxID=325217 RepID=UPI003671A22F
MEKLTRRLFLGKSAAVGAATVAMATTTSAIEISSPLALALTNLQAAHRKQKDAEAVFNLLRKTKRTKPLFMSPEYDDFWDAKLDCDRALAAFMKALEA